MHPAVKVLYPLETSFPLPPQSCRLDFQGITIGLELFGDFGPTVCKFGPDALKPVMEQTLDILIKQSPEQLARLPQLADTMANVDPAILTVSEPLLEALDPSVSLPSPCLFEPACPGSIPCWGTVRTRGICFPTQSDSS
jgi:hypothetical protein